MPDEEIIGDFYVKRNKVLYCIENGTGEKKVESAQIEVAKKAQIEAICTFEKRKREEDRANIASLRCLQKTEIILTNDGEVEIRKELFGATKTDRSNFRIVNFTILQTQLQDEEKEVLLIEFNSAGRSKKAGNRVDRGIS